MGASPPNKPSKPTQASGRPDMGVVGTNSMLDRRFPPPPAALAHGACVGPPHPDWWFPRTIARENWRDARKVCGTCPVRPECWTYGEQTGAAGVWGGMVRSLESSLQHRRRRKATT